MKRLGKVPLPANEQQALKDLRSKILNRFDIESLVLYGSVVRGHADKESDIDLLIVTTWPLSRAKRHEITDIVFEVNLRYGTNFSTLVVDRQSWEKGPASVLPLRKEILKDGIPL